VSTVRFPIAFVLALAFTGALFWLLWAMISSQVEIQELKVAPKIEFTRLRRDTEVRRANEQKAQREKPVQAPQMPQVARASFDRGSSEALSIMAPEVDPRASISKMAVSVGGSDRDVIPLVRIEPEYPPRASARGVEGYAVVQFTITPVGTVKDPIVVDADPKGIFDAAAVKAVGRWKYNPKVENGVAVERRGVQVRLSFKLEK
jgi:periplasmic protein TonB